MLNRLSIRNYALINQIDIDFQNGLSIITGETGAGKSIMLGALSLILGERADIKKIGNSDKKSVVEAVFDVKNYDDIKEFCELNDLDFDEGQVILRREISSSGRSRSFVNDTPVNLSQLKDLAIKLVDIHSQHQNQLISDSKYQLRIIDSIATNSRELTEYRQQFKKYIKLRNNLQKKRQQLSTNRENEEFLRFQLEQLNRLTPKKGEQDVLEHKYEVLSNAESIKEDLQGVISLLRDNEDSVLSQLNTIKSLIGKFNFDLFSSDNEIRQRFENVYIELKDMSDLFIDYLSDIDIDPLALEKIDVRLNEIYEANRRFKVECEDDLVNIRENIEQQLTLIDNSDDDILALESELKSEGKRLRQLADILTDTRIKASQYFSTQLIEQAKPLGMSNIKFSSFLTQSKLTIDGQDNVEFLCSFNKNQDLQPIYRVASGGEMSRIMLCVKSIIAKTMRMPTIIFDEIDTGVSGDIANKMGEMMNDMSTDIQVITITHLPQVASKGQSHYKVYKIDNDDSTITNIKQLTESERISELALMLSGSSVDEAAIRNAQSLLNQ